MRSAPFLLTLVPALAACSSTSSSFRSDADFLAAHAETIEIPSGTGSFVVCPALQGRVMTAALAADGAGLGFVNRPAIAEPDPNAAFSNHGGAERFWIGPESGPYAVFFERGQAHTRDNWRVPAGLDRGPFEVVERGPAGVVMEKLVTLTNLKGAVLRMKVRRAIEAPGVDEVAAALGGQASGINLPWTAFRSRTTVVNDGDQPWTRERGLPCIWILGMFAPGPETWVIAPFGPKPDPDGGPAVRADYFGAVAPDRFRLGSTFAIFRADAQQEGKIGVLRNRATDRLAAWDPQARVLTLVKFGPIQAGAPYLSEHWGETLPDPYYGDGATAYNRGGPARFFELESSSPALALAPGASHTHESLTIHLHVASDAVLDSLLKWAVGVDPAEFHRLAGDR